MVPPLRLPGRQRDTVVRRLAHEPFGWRPTTLLVTVRRYRCTGCGHVWRQDTTKAAEPRAKLSRRGLRWALEALVVQHLTVARVAEALGVSWNTANDAVLAEGQRVLIDDLHRFDGVTTVGFDEHVWRHTRRGDKYVTVIIDLTPIRDGTGPARLLDMVEGRSKQAVQAVARRTARGLAAGVEVVAMDGFTGFKTAAAEEVPDAVAVMDPFHVVAPGRRRVGPVPPPGPAGSTATAAARRPALPPADPAHRSRPAHRQADAPARSPVRRRRARPGRSDLGHLPAHDRRLPRTRPNPRPRTDAEADRQRQPRRAGRADRDHHPRPDPDASEPPTSWPTSTDPAPATAPPRPSTAASNTSAAPPSDSATSPTTSPDHCSRPAGSRRGT